MADKYWIGGDAGGADDFSIAANWSPLGVPSAGDNLYYMNGSQDCQTNVDQSGTAFGNLVIGGDYTGTVGSSSDYLYGDFDKITIRRSQDTHEQYIGVKSGDTLTGPVVIEGGKVYFKPVSGMTAPDIILLRKGELHLYEKNGQTLPQIIIGWRTTQASDAKLYFDKEITVTALRQMGGVVYLDNDAEVTDHYMHGGTAHYADETNPVELHQYGGIVYDKRRHDSTDPSLYLYGGTYYANQDPDIRNFVKCMMYGSASANFANGAANQTFTDGPDVYGQNMPVFDVAQEVSPSAI